MKAKERIRKALAAKNWDIRSYYQEPIRNYAEGREGGYNIVVETEVYPEIWPQTAENDLLAAAYDKAWDNVDRDLFIIYKHGGNFSECSMGGILAYTVADVLHIISCIPDRLTITA